MTFIFLIGVACGSMFTSVCALVALHCVRHVNRPRQTLGVRPRIEGDMVRLDAEAPESGWSHICFTDGTVKRTRTKQE